MEQDHLHPHGPDDGPGAPERMDAAQRSLADALRVSFRLLSVLMVIVLGALLVTGVTQIHPGQVGVRLLFGRIQGQGDQRVLGEGLRWSLPEPIGRVIKVPTGKQELEIKDFWCFETAEDALKRPSERTPPLEGLRPGFDGALLTGDRGLVHVKFTVLCGVRSRDGRVDPEAVIDYVSNLRQPEEPVLKGVVVPATPAEAVRSAVCSAAIAAAATRTVDAIYATGQKGFADDVAALAQQRLDELQTGIVIYSVLVPVSTVPLAVIPAFDAVTSARQDQEGRQNQALGDEYKILQSVAGASWSLLVADPRTGQAGLIDQYAKAREQQDSAAAEAEALSSQLRARPGDADLRKRSDQARQAAQSAADAARDLLAEIDEVLVSRAEGEVAQVVNAARAYSATIRQEVESRADRFRRLRQAHDEAPELLRQRLWAEVKQELLSAPTNEKYYLSPGQKLNLLVNQDPEVLQRIIRERLKAEGAQPGGASKK